MKVAEARNVLGEVISRAHFGGEPTIFVNRGKRTAAVVSYAFLERAIEALNLELNYVEDSRAKPEPSAGD
jgi:prevent-host-death family protein